MKGERYRHSQNVGYLADFPGARVEKDRIAVVIEAADDSLLVDETIPVEVTKMPDADENGEWFSGSFPDWGVHSRESVEFHDPEETPDWYPDGHIVPFVCESDGGVTRLSGVVESTGAYSVHLLYGDPETSLINLSEIETDVTGTTTIDEPAITPSCGVLIEDTSDEPDQQEVSGLIHVA